MRVRVDGTPSTPVRARRSVRSRCRWRRGQSAVRGTYVAAASAMWMLMNGQQVTMRSGLCCTSATRKSSTRLRSFKAESVVATWCRVEIHAARPDASSQLYTPSPTDARMPRMPATSATTQSNGFLASTHASTSARAVALWPPPPEPTYSPRGRLAHLRGQSPDHTRVSAVAGRPTPNATTRQVIPTDHHEDFGARRARRRPLGRGRRRGDCSGHGSTDCPRTQKLLQRQRAAEANRDYWPARLDGPEAAGWAGLPTPQAGPLPLQDRPAPRPRRHADVIAAVRDLERSETRGSHLCWARALLGTTLRAQSW